MTVGGAASGGWNQHPPTLADSAHPGAEGFEIDAGTLIVGVTPRLERFLGVGPAELRQAPLERIVAPADLDLVTAALAGLVENGQHSTAVAASLRRSNGESFAVTLTVSRKDDPQDQVSGFTILVDLANTTPAPPPPPPPPVPPPAAGALGAATPPAEPRRAPEPMAPASPPAAVGPVLRTAIGKETRKETGQETAPILPASAAPAYPVPSAPLPPPRAGDRVTAAQIQDDKLPPAYRRLPIAAALVTPDGLVVDATDDWLITFVHDPGHPTADEQVEPGGTGALNLFDICHPASRAGLEAAFADLWDHNRADVRHDTRCRSTRGQLWCRISANLIDGSELAAVSIEDITTSRAEQRSLVANEALFRNLAETSPVGVARLSSELVIDYTNPRWRALTNTDNLANARSLTDIVEPDDQDRVRTEIAERLSTQSAEPIRCRLRRPADKAAVWLSLRIAELLAPDRGVVGHMAVIEDITDLVQAQESSSELAGIVESSNNLVGIFDLPGRKVRYLNAAAQDLFCPPDAEVADLVVSDLYTDASAAQYADEIFPVLRRGEAWTGELSMVRSDGAIIRVRQTFTAELDARGNIRRLSTLGQDVTDQVAAHDRLAYQATHDSLTGLPNRSLLIDHMELALARSARDKTPVALLFLDLDRFKQINDNHGHDTGDLLLQEVAHRLRQVIRPSDTVARLGGDEFVVLAEDIEGERDALRIAERVRSALEDEPFELGNIVAPMSASIGISLSNGGDMQDTADLLKNADTAMFRAKRSGRARAELFDEAQRERSAQRAALADELKDALQQGLLVAYFHPLVDLETNRIVATEALARWVHPTRGVLPARDFIDIAIDAGLAAEVDAASARHAVAQAADWYRTLGSNSPVVHINASRHSLENDGLADLLGELMAHHELPNHRLCIEVAESIINEDGSALIAQLDRFHALGLRIAVDAIGSSALPLSQLRRYPLSMLKVGASMTADAPADRGQLIGGIAALAGAMNFHFSAEGVNSPDLIPVLRRAGVRSGQGDAFAQPMPAHQATDLLRQHFGPAASQ